MTVTFSSIFNDLILLFSFLLAGYVIRELVKPIQWLYIPASVVAGVIALILGPQVLGLVTIPETFGSMAGVMITMVLTASVIGVDFDSSKAEQELGFRCRPFSESIRDTVTWLKEEGFLDTAENSRVVDIDPAALLHLLLKMRGITSTGRHINPVIPGDSNTDTDKIPIAILLRNREMMVKIFHIVAVCEFG